MLVLIWIVALVAAVALYCHNTLSSKFYKRGVKADNVFDVLKTQFRIVMGWENSADVIKRNYFLYPKERFVGSYLFGSSALQLHDLDLIKKVTIKDFEHFLDHREFGAGDPLFSRNLLSLKGDEWKEMRSNLSPAFTSSKIRLMVPFMVEVGDQMMLSLKKSIKESGSKYLEMNGKELTSRYSSDVIASCAFGLKVNSHGDPTNEFYARGLEIVAIKPSKILIAIVTNTAPWLAKLLSLKTFSEKTYNFFMDLVLSTMENREKNKIFRPDMINLLMEAKKGKLVYEEQTQGPDAGFATVEESAIGKEKRKGQKEWTDVDLVAQAVIFFHAGFNTVSSAMSFLLYELAMNPDVQDRLVKEIKETHAKNEGKFDYNSILQMTYLDMVISEVMRKWPLVIALDRICVKDYNMGKPNDESREEYIIRRGELVQIPLWGIQRDPRYFPEPLKFDPERFSDENKHKIKPLTYSPFGIGPRNCIGSRFALCEVKVMAYQLLQHFEVSPGPRTTITTELDPKRVSVAIKGGHWVRISART